MKSLIESCLASNDPQKRSKDDLQALLPWFKRYGKGVLRDAENDMLIEILQNCIFQKFQKDDIIIFEGDVGDSFFILIEGQVSIYVRDLDCIIDDSKKKRLSLFNSDVRSMLGQCVLREGEGYSFGEYALLDENRLRKASVVAEEDCSLIMVDTITYNNCLKNLQKEILIEREKFIKDHVLFRDCSLSTKEIIKMSLKNIKISHESNLITQGEKWKGLIFITRGSGRLTVESDKHETQYPEFFPLDFSLYDKRYTEFPELRPSNSQIRRSDAECLKRLIPKLIRLKRAKDYAALENHIMNHNKRICTVQSGEIVGDLELIFNLDTNLYSITCQEEIEAFFLEDIHIKRVLKRINPNIFFDHLKLAISSKLEYREKYFTKMPVPLMLFLKTKLYYKTLELSKEYPKMITKKELPNIEAEWQHLIKMYDKNKAPLFLPYIRGSVYLKDLMKINADQRQKEKNRNNDDNLKLTENRTSTFPIRQRSIYRLQKTSRDPVHFIEIIQKELNKQRKLKPKISYHLVSRTLTNDSFNDLTNLNQENKEEKMSIGPTSKMHSDLDIPNKISKETNSAKIINYRATIKTISALQKSQVAFLNTLCSDKSCYDLKTMQPKQDNTKTIRTYFLPNLQNQNTTIKSNDSPRKGARVVIKSRPCDALSSQYKLVDHSHRISKFIDKIDDWE